MKKIFLFLTLLISGFSIVMQKTNACSRLVYTGKNDIVITARSMDWASDFHTNIWVLPRGVERNGLVGDNSVKWTSKYGSVVSTTYDIGTPDGMNEKGLHAAMLWLKESVYPTFNDKTTGLAISVWGQYALDNFATVAEAVAEFSKEKFVVVTDKMPGTERLATMHLGLSDANGDNAIFEYIDGKLKIYHSKEYKILTNSPAYDEQLAIAKHWEEVGFRNMLPGSHRAADRFVRATYYMQNIPELADDQLAVSTALSVIRNVSVPLGVKGSAENPNISSTLWRTISDQKNKIYYFDSPYYPNVIWLDLKDIDFSPQVGTRKLDLQDKSKKYSENSVKDLIKTEPFKFMGLSN